MRDLLASSNPLTISETSLASVDGNGSGARANAILVVGGAGYVGSIVATRLLAAGRKVVVVDPLLYGAESISPLIGRSGFELHVADTRDESIMRDVLARVGSVIHFGEIVGDPACNLDPAVTLAVNHSATVRLAELASQAGIERFIYPSSCSVYGWNDAIVDESSDLNPVSLYGRIKRSVEESILSLRSDTFHPSIFRLATVYGLSPRPRFDLVVNILAGRAAADGRIVVQGGGQWRPFVHVADVAEMLISALTLPLDRVSGEIFNLGANSQNHTIADVAEIVRSRVPDVSVEVTDDIDSRNYRVSFDKAAEILGFRTSRTVGDGVREIVDAIETGSLADLRDPRHSNVRALLETDARQRLWRDDIPDGGRPDMPFLPRDVEALLRSGPPSRTRLVEDAVS